MSPDPSPVLSGLREILPEAAFRPVTAHYLEEPRGRFAGQAQAVLAPESTEQVAQIIRLAGTHGAPVIPFGGGTGLVGGQIKQDGAPPLLLSLERMRQIRGVYPEEHVVIAEAGVILQDLQKAASEAGLLFPLSLASEGSCQIGGNLATNAGGVNVLRYGNARDQCLGLEAVLPDGSVWNGLKRLRKDNTGYDLRNLLIGSEGTLGVITAASLRLVPRPTSEAAGFLVVPDPAAALNLLALAQKMVGEGVSAFELIHRQGLEFMQMTMPERRLPFTDLPEWCVLIDLGLFGGGAADQALLELFEAALDAELVSDGMIASSGAQRQAFWEVRELLPEANRRIGSVSSHDVSLPLGALPDFIEAGFAAIARLGPFRVNCFGHVGDGNLHYNVYPPEGGRREEYWDRRDEIKACIHDLVHSFDGSVSAEHGIGRLKIRDLQNYGDASKLTAMRAIKAALDPKGIMNPGAVLAQN